MKRVIDMEGYTKVEFTSYVKQSLESGTIAPINAEKFARIIAKEETVCETVISWSVDSQGNEIQEKIHKCKLTSGFSNKSTWMDC